MVRPNSRTTMVEARELRIGIAPKDHPATRSDPTGDTVDLQSPHGAILRATPRTAMFGRFRVIDDLGEGRMGVVGLTHDPDLDRKVAIKVLRGTASAGARARLLRARRPRAARHARRDGDAQELERGRARAAGRPARDESRQQRRARRSADRGALAAREGLFVSSRQAIAHRKRVMALDGNQLVLWHLALPTNAAETAAWIARMTSTALNAR